MWTMLLLLWSVPLAGAILIFARLGDGSPALTDREAKLLLGDEKSDWSPRLLVELVVIGLFLFMAGLFEGLVLPNFGVGWSIAAALLTGVAAIAVVSYRLRTAPRRRRARTKVTRQNALYDRIAHLFTH
jgi:hypothetical protein